MNILGYGIMAYLSIIYEVFKVLFYVLGTLCFISTCSRTASPAPRCCGTVSLPSRLWSHPLNKPTAFRHYAEGGFYCRPGKTVVW